MFLQLLSTGKLILLHNYMHRGDYDETFSVLIRLLYSADQIHVLSYFNRHDKNWKRSAGALKLNWMICVTSWMKNGSKWKNFRHSCPNVKKKFRWLCKSKFLVSCLGAEIAQSLVCWARCAACCSVAGLTLFWASGRGEFFLGVNRSSDSIP